MALTVLSLLLASTQLAVSQFVTAPTNLTSKAGHANVTVRYKEVPAGICEQDPNVKSYSGYADVAENEHIFWWFFEARNVDPSEAPLTVWINGGPGSSSMIGLFQELGPCTVNSSGVPVDNPFSWSNASNLLFIDQPTTTGFSYSIPVPAYTDPDTGDIITLPNNTCPEYASDWGCGTYSIPDVSLTANSTPNAAPNFYKTIQGFMGAFPQYSQHDFFFATESYGGHYGPVFSEYIVEQNDLAANGTVPINLKALLVGNGWFDPLTAYEAYYNYTVTPGNTYDLEEYNATVESRLYNNLYGKGNCYDQIVQCNANPDVPEICSTADSFCYANVELVFDVVTGRDEYDVRELTPDPFPPTFYVDYLNLPEVQAAIGAFVNYSEGSSTVGDAFASTGDDAISFDIPTILGTLISRSITTVLYYGDADYICNWIGGLALLPLIKPLPTNFLTSAGYADIETKSLPSSYNAGIPLNGQVGQVRQIYNSSSGSENFAFVRIYESGHEVPFYQPAGALAMFERVVQGLDIATGTVPLNSSYYITQGNLSSTYREGNTTVQTDVLDTDTGDWTYDVGTGLPVNGTVEIYNATATSTKRSGKKDSKKRTDRTARNMPWKRDVDFSAVRADFGL